MCAFIKRDSFDSSVFRPPKLHPTSGFIQVLGNKIPGLFQDTNAAFPGQQSMTIINHSNKHANVGSTMHSTAEGKKSAFYSAAMIKEKEHHKGDLKATVPIFNKFLQHLSE